MSGKCLWKIWYDDYSTYSSLDGPPEEAPPWGVVVVSLPDEKIGRSIQKGKDYYLWREGGWWGADHIGFIDYLQMPGWKRVLFGRTVETELFNEICQMARYECTSLPYEKP